MTTAFPKIFESLSGVQQAGLIDFATALTPYQYPYLAAANGTTDDTAAIAAVLADAASSGAPVDGGGLTYAVSGAITLPDNLVLRNIKFLQLTPTVSNCRTLTKTTGSGNITLQNVKVDRGSQTAVGDPNNFAGIWLANISHINLYNVEVTGNGPGMGILLSTCSDVAIVNPYIHDMTWSASVDPGIDQIAGIRWANGCTKVRVVNPYISKLGGLIGLNPIRYWQTDGMDPGGVDWSVIGGYIEFVNEGIDTHASEGCFSFNIIGTQFVSCDSYGLKLGNLSQNGVAIGCIMTGCGLTGCIVNSTSPNVTSNILVQGCKAINTGATGTWPGANTCGFAVLQDYTNNVRLIECEAIDNQGSPTMKYGFRCDFAPNASQTRMNIMRGCFASGYITSATTGDIGEFECSVTRGAAQTIPDTTPTAMVWDNTVIDTYIMSAGAGVITIKESGLYTVDVGVEFTGNATGYRLLTLFVNGVGSSYRTWTPGSAACNQSLKLSVRLVLTIGDQLTFVVQQTSTAPLATVGGQCYAIVTRDYGAL